MGPVLKVERKKIMRKTSKLVNPPAVLRVFTALVACYLSVPGRLLAGSYPPPKLAVQDSPLNRDLRTPISFSPVVRKVAPSVVNIYSTTAVHERQLPNTLLNDPFLR